MRTTVEISDEARARLLEVAARRGEKGFSSVVEEALAQYFAVEEKHEEKVRKALECLGKLSEEEAAEIESSVAKLRESWR